MDKFYTYYTRAEYYRPEFSLSGMLSIANNLDFNLSISVNLMLVMTMITSIVATGPLWMEC